MPRFNVTSPDGRTFEVNAPEGATKEDAIAYVQKMQASKPQPAPQAEPAAPQRSTGQEVGRQLGLTGRAALEGAGDLLGIFTNPVQSGLARLTGAPEQSLADAAT